MPELKVIDDIVNALAEQHGKKITELLLKTWEIGLSGVPDEYCLKALERSLKTGVFDYFPTSGKFRDLCREVRSETIKSKRSAGKEPEQIPLNRTEAKKAYSGLIGGMRGAPKWIIPKLRFYEYFNFAGDLTELVCPGHVDIKLFEAEAKRISQKSMRIVYKYGIQRQKSKTDENGRVISVYTETEYVSNYQVGSSVVTIGYF